MRKATELRLHFLEGEVKYLKEHLWSIQETHGLLIDHLGFRVEHAVATKTLVPKREEKEK